MRYEFHPEALQEYRQAMIWYAEREPRVALEFVEAVEEAIERILESPTRWRVIEEDIRRCHSRLSLRNPLHNRIRVLANHCRDALQPRA